MATDVLLAAADPTVLRDLIAQFPRGDDWLPMAARAATQVARVIQKRTPAVAVVHHTLDDTTGVEFCAWLSQQSPQTLCILLVEGIPPASKETDPFELALRHPSPPGILTDVVIQALQKRYAMAASARFLAEVREKIKAAEAQDYYVLLGVPEDANQIDLRRAYDSLSMRYHPDRHMHMRGTQGFRDLTDLYKRIGEANRILGDYNKKILYEKQRKRGNLRYDETVREKAGPKSLEDLSDNPRCKRFLKLAQQAVGAGRTRSALQNLKFAQSMDRDNQDIADKIAELEGK